MTTKLSVHRNKVEARRKRELAADVDNRVGRMVRECDIRAYAFVGIAADGKAYALWDTGAVLPLWAFADTVATILRTDIQDSNVADDWRPNLRSQGEHATSRPDRSTPGRKG